MKFDCWLVSSVGQSIGSFSQGQFGASADSCSLDHRCMRTAVAGTFVQSTDRMSGVVAVHMYLHIQQLSTVRDE